MKQPRTLGCAGVAVAGLLSQVRLVLFSEHELNQVVTQEVTIPGPAAAVLQAIANPLLQRCTRDTVGMDDLIGRVDLASTNDESGGILLTCSAARRIFHETPLVLINEGV
jgi:hypothetical protein